MLDKEFKKELLKDMEYYTFKNELNLWDIEGNFLHSANCGTIKDALTFVKNEAEKRGIKVEYFNYNLNVNLLNTL